MGGKQHLSRRNGGTHKIFLAAASKRTERPNAELAPASGDFWRELA